MTQKSRLQIQQLCKLRPQTRSSSCLPCLPCRLARASHIPYIRLHPAVPWSHRYSAERVLAPRPLPTIPMNVTSMGQISSLPSQMMSSMPNPIQAGAGIAALNARGAMPPLTLGGVPPMLGTAMGANPLGPGLPMAPMNRAMAPIPGLPMPNLLVVPGPTFPRNQVMATANAGAGTD